MTHPAHRPRIAALLLAAGLALAAAGCSIRLVSNYDETTDKAVSALQKKTETHLVALEAAEGLPECRYDHYPAFYKEAKVDVSAIAVRAAAIPNNELTTEETQLLARNYDALEQLHKIACLSKDQIATLRSQFNTCFTAILKLELAKRRGD
ncbi:hypothetical protein EZJ19_12350 [Parasulfuritortus cantonensis]|uniref:Lipoprotein n=1 Tax=Parasulfuritortus cantonensis TaxID=2528202 RepID=A0A4R1B2Q1_9PROT|nr:hypothetical protein [Parasulfuritortus cantonensis]TCJ12324.1 hypothetical protein EZJ19_12350 [Parasulfuritortus cantonensis]